MDEALRALAEEAGIANDWVDANSEPHRVEIDSLRAILTTLGFACESPSAIAESRARLRHLQEGERPLVTATVGSPVGLKGLQFKSGTSAELVLEDGRVVPVALETTRDGIVVPPIDQPGYHRLRSPNREITVAVAPPRCVSLSDVAGDEKLYGLAVQLYALQREGDFGVGDTTALREFVSSAARNGADAIALSPVHSLFAADAGHYSPYSPSSRLFLNPLYADPAAVFGEMRAAAAKSKCQLGAPQQDRLIDWPRVAHLKYAVLRALFEDFAEIELSASPNALASDFHSFVAEGGDLLAEHALFEAAHAHFLGAADPKWDWREWPDDWRTPSAPGIRRLAQEARLEVQFHMFLQWIAARCFSSAQLAAREQGMCIGLISDLAVGMSAGGSHAWSRQDDLLLGLSVGAPPDFFNPRGQDWGLTSFSPQALLARGFEPFIATLRAALRHAGGVRIDHAMGLTRLWLVPRGASPVDGAYLRYPIDDLLRLLALESYRHGAIVIGEDLGTVPEDFRARLSECAIAGMDILWFERKGRSFLPSRAWRRDAVAMTSTHDLPTVAGWWSGADIETRDAIGLVTDKQKEVGERAKDRKALWRRFRTSRATAIDQPAPEDVSPVADAAISFVAQSPAPLALVPIEDVLALADQPNLPGTIDEHPNWRRRLERPASQVLDAPEAQHRLKILRERK